MAKAKKITETVTTGVSLLLDEEETGYLFDLLHAHVGGKLTQSQQPLGRIASALQRADVKRFRAYNKAYPNSRYAALYRTLDETL